MKEIIKAPQILRPKILLFDMDGTLYRHDGENGTFINSSLQNMVIQNSVDFVIKQEGCGVDFAKKLIAEAQKDSIGISNVLSKRYGITRSEIFEATWNIDPRIVVKDFEKAVEIINSLKKIGQKMFLITAAPRVWMENVVGRLGLEACFERIINGEQFATKSDVFVELLQEFKPEDLLSVGDQFETDIKPAKELGMKTFLVKSPDDLVQLI